MPPEPDGPSAADMGERLVSPAKINLVLTVLGRRPDGYHDIQSLMCPVSLCDEVHVGYADAGIQVACGHPRVPVDATNTAFRAASLFFQVTGIRPAVRIRIQKRIPVGAGLGGGSSNAAAVLRALDRHFGHPLSFEALCGLAASVGADVPFFIHGKPAWVSGVGEVVEPFESMPRIALVLVYPGFSVSTRWVYENLNLALTNRENRHKSRLLKDRKFSIPCELWNDLEAVTASGHPEVRAIQDELRKRGAAAASMSGSGPTVFGLFPDPDKALGACRTLEGHRPWEVFFAETIV